MAKIIGIDDGSIAQDLGLKVGDELVAFDGRPIDDILDYCYYDSLDKFVMTVRDTNGEETDYEIEKNDDEFLGMDLDESVQLTPIHCKNKCKFCFVDQLPKGMRETLYVKDDDYRLSFVSGNFITLTNVKEPELERIVRLKLSPLYISVHATDPKIKRHLVANPEGEKTYEKIKYLTANGIKINAQVVMCPDENDSEVLRKTLTDLAELRPMVMTCAVVPVGLTGHREGLYPLKQVDQAKAIESIGIVRDINEKYGEFCWCSDEFYIKAGVELPAFDEYGDFEQIENGVGLVRTFENDVNIGLENIKKSRRKREVTLITGKSFSRFLAGFIDNIKNKLPRLDAEIVAIINDFFGESITVAGLITATDIIKQAKGKVKKNVIIPSNMLREFTTTFLDGMSVEELEKELNAKIYVCRDGEHLVEILRSL